MSIRRPPIVAATIAAAAILAIGLATSSSIAAGPEAAPAPQATGYRPSISDLMIATIQPRHQRLWRAGQDSNWEFAAYELGNLHGAFDRLGHAHPTEHDISFPQMIDSVTEQPLKDLDSAIQAVNQGHIYQCVVKPWEIPDLGMVLQRAAEAE